MSIDGIGSCASDCEIGFRYFLLCKHFIHSLKCLARARKNNSSTCRSIYSMNGSQKNITRLFVPYSYVLLNQIYQRHITCFITMHQKSGRLVNCNEVVILVNYAQMSEICHELEVVYCDYKSTTFFCRNEIPNGKYTLHPWDQLFIFYDKQTHTFANSCYHCGQNDKKMTFRSIIPVFLLIFSCFSLFSQIREKHLGNIRQLTYGGDNAEAYFSFDNKKLIFQSNNKKWGLSCDQIFIMDIEAAARDSQYMPTKVSTGKGRTTCSYFLKGDKKIVYASTHEHGESCPEVVSKPGKYTWNIYDYDIYIAGKKGKNIKMIAGGKGYQAEATVSPKGDKIVYTSDESGDLELWIMNTDGSEKRQITHDLGYDGGAFFSPDGKKLVFRASRPGSDVEAAEYKSLLKEGLVTPNNMEIFTINVDGTDMKQITRLGKANWAPFFSPDGQKIIFSSNHHSKRGYDFQLYMVNATDGSEMEQITFESMFNAFAMFSPDGKKLVFCSNRNNHGTRDTNVFIADWIK